MSNIQSTVLMILVLISWQQVARYHSKLGQWIQNWNLLPAISLTPQLFVRIAAPDETGMYVALVEIGRLP